MKIETRYNIGDEVWVKDFLRGRFSQPLKTKIMAVTLWGTEEDDIFYRCSIDENHSITIEEKHLSPTKEELLKSL